MSGGRYAGWTHLQLQGDYAAAQSHIPAARKALGFVMDEAQRWNLGTHKYQMTLSDGTVITAEKHGDIPRITIAAGETDSPAVDPMPPDDIVVWARSAATAVGGIDAQFPQQIIRSEWKTYFYSADIAGYDEFLGSKGTYQGRLPEGARRAGNVDWLGPAGERLSWYGPASRYFTEPYIQPAAQYGRKVFLLGSVLFDAEQYIADSGMPSFAQQFVLGAAMRGLWLYVVQTDIPNFTTPDPAPYPAALGFVTPAFPEFESDVVLARYALLVDPSKPVATRLSVVPGSREVLWGAAMRRMWAPWFFNQQVTECACFGLPAQLTWYTSLDAEVEERVSASSPAYTIAITHSGSTASATLTEQACVLAPAPSDAVVAVDYVDDQKVSMRMHRRTQVLPVYPFAERQFHLEFAGVEYPLQTSSNFRYVMHADLRQRTILFLSLYVRDDGWDCAVELYRDGKKVLSVPREFATHVAALGFPTYVTELLATGAVGSFDDWSITGLFPLYATVAGHVRTSGGYRWYDISFPGSLGLLRCVYRLQDDLHGLYKSSTAGSGTALPVAIASLSGYEAGQVRTDFDGNVSVLSCVTQDGITALSCYRQGEPEESIHSVTRSGLGDLTGIGGAGARYHPMWLLGKPPLQSR